MLQRHVAGTKSQHGHKRENLAGTCCSGMSSGKHTRKEAPPQHVPATFSRVCIHFVILSLLYDAATGVCNMSLRTCVNILRVINCRLHLFDDEERVANTQLFKFLKR